MLTIRDEEIQTIEHILLPSGCRFPEDARAVIRCWESKDVAACPGSGKTTVLIAKLKLLADRMPLRNGAGVCVLSHTNIAIDEIKRKMANYTRKLTEFPNYVGTIQTFINQYVTRPYIKYKFGRDVQVVDNHTYAEHLCRIINSWKYKKLTGCIKIEVAKAAGQYMNEVDYVSNLYLRDDGALCMYQRKRPLAGPGKPAAEQYQSAQRDILKQEGLIRYSDSYQYAADAVTEFSDKYTNLFCSRFRYVFIDEYQDCKESQRIILTKLFDSQKCCVFRIGDSDQAIYESNNDNDVDWQPEENHLPLRSSNRYGQEIADVLTSFRTGKQKITTSCGTIGYKPVLIVYDINTISAVIQQFIFQLDAHGLTDVDGIYKAIGHIRKKSKNAITIGSYWDGFCPKRKREGIFSYWGAVDNICEKLDSGNLYLVEPILRKLICRILHYCNVVNEETGKDYTFFTLKRMLNKSCDDLYRDTLKRLTALSHTNRQVVSEEICRLIRVILEVLGKPTQKILKSIPSHFMKDDLDEQIRDKDYNVFSEKTHGRRIQFDTVHGVKGETHDATLYMETTTRGSTDIVRVLPWLGIGTPGASPLYDYSRKMVYVGCSRPRKLLCVAIQESTFVKSGTAFQNWEIIDIRKNEA